MRGMDESPAAFALAQALRIRDLEENLAFAQERAANNHIRATLGEEKIADLVAEIRDLKAAARRCEVADKRFITELADARRDLRATRDTLARIEAEMDLVAECCNECRAAVSCIRYARDGHDA